MRRWRCCPGPDLGFGALRSGRKNLLNFSAQNHSSVCRAIPFVQDRHRQFTALALVVSLLQIGKGGLQALHGFNHLGAGTGNVEP